MDSFISIAIVIILGVFMVASLFISEHQDKMNKKERNSRSDLRDQLDTIINRLERIDYKLTTNYIERGVYDKEKNDKT